MHGRTKLFTMLVMAALMATSGSAFTAANTGIDDAFVGYGSNTVSGVAVTNIAYNVDATDASKLSSIVFTETEDVSVGYDAVLTINGPTTTQIACDTTVVGTIDCPTTANVADVTSIALTVSAN